MNRKIAVVVLAGVLLMSNTRVMNVHGEEVENKSLPIEVSADISAYSSYMWRGFKIDGDPVVQSGISISGYGVTLSAWGDFATDTGDYGLLKQEEFDYAIDYTYKFDKLSLSAGYTYYDFPSSETLSREYYIGAGLDVPMSPTLTFYHDYGKEECGGGDGDYIVLASSYSVPLGNTVTLDLSGHIGYNNELFIEGEGGDMTLGFGFTIPLTEKLTFSPNINYSIPFGDLKDSDDGEQDNEFYGGFTLAYNF